MSHPSSSTDSVEATSSSIPGAPPSTAENASPTVAFQGEPGAFSEEALLEHFQGQAASLPCRDFQGLVLATQDGRADFGMIPVENSLAGTVAPAYDAILQGGVEIVAERILPIRHHLMALSGAGIGNLRKALSHPVALAQCTGFLRHHPHIQPTVVHDTAGAAREVGERQDRSLAAIAPAGAARRYGLSIVASDLQDRDDNQTRFYLIRKVGGGKASPATGRPDRFKTVLIVELPDQPGSLLQALDPFSREELNLAKLESRPAPVPWSYRFIVEVHGSMEDPAMDRAVAALADSALTLRVLGSFPAGSAEDASGGDVT